MKFNNRLFLLIFFTILLSFLSACSSKEVQGVRYSQPRVIEEYPHDSNAFTQGLEFFGERLFESTGLYGNSSIREIDLESGSTIDVAMLDKDLFGEGLTFLDEKSREKILTLKLTSPQKDNWENTRTLIELALEPPSEKAEARMRLLGASQTAEETLSNFGDRIVKLANLAYGDNDRDPALVKMKDAILMKCSEFGDEVVKNM